MGTELCWPWLFWGGFLVEYEMSHMDQMILWIPLPNCVMCLSADKSRLMIAKELYDVHVCWACWLRSGVEDKLCCRVWCDFTCGSEFL
jgi:hypothetical protein